MNKTLKFSLIGLGTVALFGIGYKMWRSSARGQELKSLKEDAKSEKVAADEQAKTPVGSGWDRTYWKRVGGTVPTNATASAIAKKLHDYVHDTTLLVPNADEEAIFSILSKLPSRAYLSRIADNYEMLYKVSLEKDIQTIGSDDVKKAQAIAEALPYKAE